MGCEREGATEDDTPENPQAFVNTVNKEQPGEAVLCL
jgi:hypothetical protein